MILQRDSETAGVPVVVTCPPGRARPRTPVYALGAVAAVVGLVFVVGGSQGQSDDPGDGPPSRHELVRPTMADQALRRDDALSARG